MVRFILGGVLVCALAAPAAAQSARVIGTVTDPSGAVLPAVDVRATMRDATGETTRSVATDSRGMYELSNLAAGTWALSMSLPGFETATRRVTVQGDSIEWSPTLQLGSLQETILIKTGSDEPVRRELPRPPAAAAPVPVSPRALPAGTVRVGGSIKPPMKLVDVRPVYPADAAAAGIGGVVILSAVIGADGNVRDVSTLRSPNDSLTFAAANALSGWQFTPTLLNGEPVDVRMTATFNFSNSF
jgi:protein TonB